MSQAAVNPLVKAKSQARGQVEAQIKKLIPESRKSKSKAQELARLLEQEGTLEGFVQAAGNMAYQARQKMHEAFLGEDCLSVEMAERKMFEMRQAIQGKQPTPLEQLLAERIVLCWYRIYYYEALFASNQKDMNYKSVELWEKRLDQANKRYLAAIKALATVRKLQLPNVQVNIGDKQVNVAHVAGI